ncbi:glycine--tRNA ligase subunit beta [Marinimicrobium sp. ABcell2]|uniref:glycine--tRNA ligase subunit beta n=1 Tax=Marinimicrobium sp. ABcell2 TaxID=3069751 RepID=UPI0027B82C91|nr:glycine--tRNA ligase subunit beta [Marinimicrobium sp. ABcell2]MDQ2076812.1 glycine--tRNA ligase subunit beta [Marinimicrobium sp. ABcell2]
MSADFLLELGTEELPPKTLRNLMEALRDNVAAGLKHHDLSFGEVQAYATPRRLAVLVEQLAGETPQKDLVVWGPPAKIAFDDSGAPTKAAEAFAQKNGVAVSELQTENDGKADKLLVRQRVGGQPCTELLGDIVNDALAKLPIAKRMRWSDRRAEFVRPAHWLVMLYGSEIVDAEVLGLRANRTTRGHRFHYNHDISLEEPSEYLSKLKGTGFVLADINARRALIRQQVDAEAGKVGGRAIIDRDLLDEVTALVEWPVALLGNFEKRFLNVPPEALIASMKEHQKYFHLMDSRDKLLPHFITVANIESDDPAQVIDGNERVIRPRLSDAAFFFDTDKKRTLESLRERLKPIVFQAQLGTVYQKTERVAALAVAIAGQLSADVDKARRAGQLCKSDLVTDMVSEFDNMQGIAGYYYALNDGEHSEVAKALNEQYLPRFAGDQLPDTMTGTILALADRLDTITGIFGIGQHPTGSKDPFALRRASLGVLRLLVEKELDLDLRALLTQAAGQHTALTVGDGLVDQVLAYMLERFRAWYEEDRIPGEVFQAVSAKGVSRPLDIDQRVRAVYQFSQMPQAQSLAAANKRVSNILAKSGAPKAPLEQSLLLEHAEQALAEAVHAKAQHVKPMFRERDYSRALESLADLQAPVDAFFDQVMVMTDDAALQSNRLALLQQLRELFLEVADISLLVPAKG